jgi:hypothetical protein
MSPPIGVLRAGAPGSAAAVTAKILGLCAFAVVLGGVVALRRRRVRSGPARVGAPVHLAVGPHAPHIDPADDDVAPTSAHSG